MGPILKFLIALFGPGKWSYYYRNIWLVNKGTGEVHDTRRILKKCTRYMAEHNKLYMSEYDLLLYKEKHPHINGCIFCNKENDTDSKFNGTDVGNRIVDIPKNAVRCSEKINQSRL